jgi:hypothetical protein
MSMALRECRSHTVEQRVLRLANGLQVGTIALAISGILAFLNKGFRDNGNRCRFLKEQKALET